MFDSLYVRFRPMCRVASTALLSIALLAGCKDDPASPADDEEPSGAQAAEDGEGSAETDEEGAESPAEPSVLSSEELDDVEMPPAGEFRLEVAGEVHEGALTQAGCVWMSTEDEGVDQDRLEATSERWTTDDGRAMEVNILRFVNMNDFYWKPSGGHEGAMVTVRLRDDGNESALTSLNDTAFSRVHLKRTKPGDEPDVRYGEGQMPLVKISEDRRQVTATGSLEARENYDGEFGQPLTGPFTLALRCPE